METTLPFVYLNILNDNTISMTSTSIIIAIVASVIIIALVVAWALTIKNVGELKSQVSERDATIIRKDGEIRTAEVLRESEREQHEKALADLKETNTKAIEAANTALALENEKILQAREEALKKEAAETMKTVTAELDKNIKDMKTAFDTQKATHIKESESIKTKFEETVKHLKEQTESLGTQAEGLANALKGKNKVQGNWGEAVLENMLKNQGLREGQDYESEYWLRDKNGKRIRNVDTNKHMRPDFVLHFPDDTDILLDSKVSLTALTDYYSATTDEERKAASERNLDSVKNQVKILSGKSYQKYVVGRKTLDYVIMFIPNYGAYQLAKAEDPGIFNWALENNVLITTEETLMPSLHLIHSAWIQKEQMENIEGIITAATNMVERVGLFCSSNAEMETKLEKVLEDFRTNSKRLVEGDKSIVKAAWKAVNHGIKAPAGKNALPEITPELLVEGEAREQDE